MGVKTKTDAIFIYFLLMTSFFLILDNSFLDLHRNQGINDLTKAYQTNNKNKSNSKNYEVVFSLFIFFFCCAFLYRKNEQKNILCVFLKKKIMKKQNVRTLSFIVSTFTYLLIGAAIFDALESQTEETIRQDLEFTELDYKQKYNISHDEYRNLEDIVIKYHPYRKFPQW